MRKTMLILFFLGLFGLPLLAQQEGENKRVKDYQSALEEGDRALKQKLYDLAVNYYNAALAFDPNQKEQIDSRIQVAFDSIKATVEAEKLKQIQILHQQKELRETTLKALYAEREAKINEEVAKKSQKEAEASKNIALSAEVSLKSEKRSAVRTLYYFNALEFAKYTGMISDKTLRKQIALTAFLLLDSTTSLITLGRTPLEVLKAMSEVQNGISLEKDGENTHITWANDSVFYFVSHRNRSHLYKVRLKHSKIIEAEIAEDSSFSKLPISKHYIKKMRFQPDQTLSLTDDRDKSWVLKKGIWEESKAIVEDSTEKIQEFRTEFSGKIFRKEKELPTFHRGLISQTDICKKYFVSAGFDGKVILYRLEDDKSIVFYYNDSPIYSVQFSPKGNYLVFGDQKRIKIIFLDTNYLAQELRKEKNLPISEWDKYKRNNRLLTQPKWHK